jgi:hypothetical protein
MIQRGKDEADMIGNMLPIFQKKLKDPSKLIKKNNDDSETFATYT